MAETHDILRGQPKFIATMSNPGAITIGQDGGVKPVAADIVIAQQVGSTEASQPNEQPLNIAENIDPLRSRIASRPKSRRGIWGLLAKVVVRSEPTAEERAALEENKRRQALEAQLRKEAQLFKARIITVLNGLGICYRYPRNKNDLLHKGLQSVRFEMVAMQPDAYYFKIDVIHLPQGINILDVVNNQPVIDHLSVACGHTVHGKYSVTTGAWFIVERAGGSLGIPAHVMWSTMMDLIPESADGLSLPLGVTTNGRRIYRSLNQMYSMLIGGTIGSGKSNVLNSFICALIRRNPPERLKLLMVDLKGGLEFGPYEGIPHLLRIPIKKKKDKDKEDYECEPEFIDGIAYSREQVPSVLEWLMSEGERRIGELKKAECRDIGRYNQRHRAHALPHLVFIVDEIADLKIDPGSWTRNMEYLTNIAQRFRAVGIHVILCTQMPRSDVIPTPIKAVLPAAMAFNCPTNQASMAILDTGDAKGLAPAGRCIFRWQEQIQIQTPLINDEQIRQIIDGAKAGTFDRIQVKQHDVTQLEAMQWALDFDSGYLGQVKLFAHFRDRGITQMEIKKWTEEWEGQEFVIGSSLYKVTPGSGSRARRLVAADQQEETKEAENKNGL